MWRIEIKKKEKGKAEAGGYDECRSDSERIADCQATAGWSWRGARVYNVMMRQLIKRKDTPGIRYRENGHGAATLAAGAHSQ